MAQSHKPNLWEYLESRNNRIKNAGFDYRGQILRRTTSGIIYSEAKRASILDSMEPVLAFLIDQVKHIKKGFNYRIPKHFRDFN